MFQEDLSPGKLMQWVVLNKSVHQKDQPAANSPVLAKVM